MSLLELADVAKSYRSKTVFSNVFFSVDEGLTLLTGPSGAGKSTLLRLLATAERPSRGQILWEGVALRRARRALRRGLGYAPQAVDLPLDLTAREFALHIASLKGLDRIAADRQFAAITDKIGLHPDIDNLIASFSGGMRRRLVFAQALLGSPRLLILDEPTAELDRETASAVAALIRDAATSAAVVMTTHDADDLLPEAATVLHVNQGTVQPL
jgi:ABC-type multidrug transport system ATPase subunit